MLLKTNEELKQMTKQERIKYFKQYGLDVLKRGFNCGYKGEVYNDFFNTYMDKREKEDRWLR